jgi:hypothetical protein
MLGLLIVFGPIAAVGGGIGWLVSQGRGLIIGALCVPIVAFGTMLLAASDTSRTCDQQPAACHVGESPDVDQGLGGTGPFGP